ncbi:hypothetical protein ENBRE01_1821 [Enteropsectra breve]|nr:hypothetical protein ENBRE01_1821 [Enteropsectra breve]
MKNFPMQCNAMNLILAFIAYAKSASENLLLDFNTSGHETTVNNGAANQIPTDPPVEPVVENDRKNCVGKSTTNMHAKKNIKEELDEVENKANRLSALLEKIEKNTDVYSAVYIDELERELSDVTEESNQQSNGLENEESAYSAEIIERLNKLKETVNIHEEKIRAAVDALKQKAISDENAKLKENIQPEKEATQSEKKATKTEKEATKTDEPIEVEPDQNEVPAVDLLPPKTNPNEVPFKQMNEHDFKKVLNEHEIVCDIFVALSDEINESIDPSSDNHLAQIKGIESELAKAFPENDKFKKYKSRLMRLSKVHEQLIKKKEDKINTLNDLTGRAAELKSELKKRNTLSNVDFMMKLKTIKKEASELKAENRDFIDNMARPTTKKIEELLKEIRKAKQEGFQKDPPGESDASQKEKMKLLNEMDVLASNFSILLEMLRRNEDSLNKIESNISILIDYDPNNKQYKAYKQQFEVHKTVYEKSYFKGLKDGYANDVRILYGSISCLKKEIEKENFSMKDVKYKFGCIKAEGQWQDGLIRSFVAELENKINAPGLAALLLKVMVENPETKIRPSGAFSENVSDDKKDTASKTQNEKPTNRFKVYYDGFGELKAKLDQHAGMLEQIKLSSTYSLDFIEIKLKYLSSYAPKNKKFKAYKKQLDEYTKEYENLKIQKQEHLDDIKDLHFKINLLDSEMNSTANIDDIEKRFNELKKEVKDHGVKIKAFIRSEKQKNTCKEIEKLELDVACQDYSTDSESFFGFLWRHWILSTIVLVVIAIVIVVKAKK